MKYKRQGQIIKIIKERNIKTHEQLINELNDAGFNVTQATVSRDIKELGLVKVPDVSGGSVYAVSNDIPSSVDKKLDVFSQAVVDIDSALHTVVIKTYPGMAPAIGVSVDAALKNEFLGSIAGDDTVLIIASGIEAANEIAEKLREMFNN